MGLRVDSVVREGVRLTKMTEHWNSFKLNKQGIYTKDDMLDISMDREMNKLKYFCPTGKQEEYIKLIANSLATTDQPIITMFAANGIGKTYLLTHILGNIIFEPQNGWFDYPVFWNFPFKHLHWHISTKTAILDAYRRAVMELYPINRYNIKPDDISNTRDLITIGYDNDWTTVSKSFDQDVDQFMSSETGIQTIDEPCPEPIWDELKQRTRGGGLALLNMTPLECDPYIQDEIDGAANNGIYFNMTATIYDCCEERGIRGFRKKQTVDDTISKMKPDQYRSRALGEFLFYAESIYPTLNAKRHLRNPDEFPVDTKTDRIIHIVDPHDGRPAASGYMAIKPNGRMIIFTETPAHNGTAFWEMEDKTRTLEQEVWDWIDIEKAFGIEKPHARIIDKFFGFQTRGGNTIANLFYKAGLKFGKTFTFMKSYAASREEGELAVGHDAVREALQDMEDGEPGLIIWNTCKHTWNGLKHYVRKRAKNQHDHNKTPADLAPIPKYKDFPDVVRYGVCAFRPSTTKASQKKELDKNNNADNPVTVRLQKSQLSSRATTGKNVLSALQSKLR